MNFDKLTILSLLEGDKANREDNFRYFTKQGFDRSFFTIAPNYYDFVINHRKKHGAYPSAQTFRGKFNIGQVDVSEPLSFYLDELGKVRALKVLGEAMDKSDNLFVRGDLSKGVSVLELAINRVKKSIQVDHDLSIRDSVDERWEKYQDRINNPGVNGIPTGFDYLDSYTHGWQKGELNMLVAKLGSMKTWTLLTMALAATESAALRAKLGRPLKVLVGTVEMGAEQLARRLDAKATSTRFENIRSGVFDNKKDIATFKRKLYQFSKNTEITIIGGAAYNEAFLRSKVELYEPDITFIDGMYLMADERGAKAHWEKMMNISMGLKILAKESNQPIIATSQLGTKEKGSKGNESADDVMYAKAIMQNADNGIALGRIYDDTTERYTGDLWVVPIKLREGEGRKFKLRYNFNTMDHEEFPDDTENNKKAGGGDKSNKKLKNKSLVDKKNDVEIDLKISKQDYMDELNNEVNPNYFEGIPR